MMVTHGEWRSEQRCGNAGNLWAGFRVGWHGFCFEEGVWPAFQTGPSGSIEAVPLRLGRFFLKFFFETRVDYLDAE